MASSSSAVHHTSLSLASAASGDASRTRTPDVSASSGSWESSAEILKTVAGYKRVFDKKKKRRRTQKTRNGQNRFQDDLNVRFLRQSSLVEVFRRKLTHTRRKMKTDPQDIKGVKTFSSRRWKRPVSSTELLSRYLGENTWT